MPERENHSFDAKIFVFFLLQAKSRVKEVYSQTCLHFSQQGMLDTDLFGLALICGKHLLSLKIIFGTYISKLLNNFFLFRRRIFICRTREQIVQICSKKLEVISHSCKYFLNKNYPIINKIY